MDYYYSAPTDGACPSSGSPVALAVAAAAMLVAWLWRRSTTASSTSVQALVAENAALKADLDAMSEWQVVSDDEVPAPRRPSVPTSSSPARSDPAAAVSPQDRAEQRWKRLILRWAQRRRWAYLGHLLQAVRRKKA